MASTSEIVTGAKQFNERSHQYERGSGGCTMEVAERLASLCGAITKDSYILDCAAGPGTVIDALLSSKDTGADATLARYAVVEPAPGMVEIVEHKIAENWGISPESITTYTKSAEEMGSLGISPGTISHAFSNFSFMFFSDAEEASRIIHRLLKPDGMAFITTFRHVGYMPPMRKACQQIRPGEEPFKLRFSDSWYDASHLERIVQSAGFEVKMEAMGCHMNLESAEMAAKSIAKNFAIASKEKAWADAEFAALPQALETALIEDTENVRIDDDGIHIKMIADIAICKK